MKVLRCAECGVVIPDAPPSADRGWCKEHATIDGGIAIVFVKSEETDNE